MANSKIDSDVTITGRLTVQGDASLPAGVIFDANIPNGQNISYEKVEALIIASHAQSQAADVATAREIVHRFAKTGSVESVIVAIDDAPTGGDRLYTVDVRKSTGGGNWTTILTAVVSVSASDTSRTAKAGSVLTPNCVAGDLIAVVVAPAGSTGTQGKGVRVEVRCAEITY
jgi:hypothetical protein